MTFEDSLGRLEEIVGALERGDLPLAEALRLFEEGVVLARAAQAQLDEAEGKIEVLLQNGERSELAGEVEGA